jgi:tetratricopeptide (TPR) repeat protein
MKEIFELYKSAREKIYHTEGLIASHVLFVALLHFGHLNPIASKLHFAAFAALAVAIQGTWHFIRRIPKFRGDQIGILFAPHGDEDVQKDIDRLRQELTSRLKASRSSKDFILKTLPPNRIVSDVDTAVMLRRRSGCMLLIWGRYERGRFQSKELRGFAAGKLNFTYAYPTEIGEANISKDIEVGIANRVWMFSSENELVERDFISSNVYDVARYIIGTCQLNFGRFQEGKELLLDILKNPGQSAWVGGAQRVVGMFIENIKAKISRADAMFAFSIYNQKIFPAGKLIKNRPALEAMVKLTEASIGNKPNGDAYLLKSIAHFLLGDLQKAKNAAARLRRLEPQNPSPCYSLGFLSAYAGDMDRAEQCYTRAFELTANVTADYIFHLSEFVAAVLELEPDKIQLHYILGLLHKELVDARFARAHFEEFVSLGHGREEMKSWAQKAQALILKLPPTDAAPEGAPA